MNAVRSRWQTNFSLGELLKLGFDVAQSCVAKYRVARRRPPSQNRRTFFRNHAPDIAVMDLFVVPTVGFDLLYAFVITPLDRRDLVWNQHHKKIRRRNGLYVRSLSLTLG
jgi:hypothetical protein